MSRSLASCALFASACGPTLWSITPHQAPTYVETLQPATVHVVHGAAPEARLVRMPYREVRAERRKARWPTAVGMVVDVFGGALLALITQDVTDEPAATVTVGAAMLGVVVLDGYLLANRNVESAVVHVDEWRTSPEPQSFDVAPGAPLRPPGMVPPAR